jgi:CRP-like cAMP-binding protein
MRLSATELGDARERLRASGWLSRCPTPFADDVLAHSQWIRVEAGQPIALGGETDGGLFGVAQGTVGIMPAIAAPDIGLIHLNAAPFWFGLQPFVNGEGRQITVLARSACLVAHLPKPALTQILARHPDGWRLLLLHLTEMAALTVQGLADLLLADRHRRCGAVILRLAGVRNPGSTPREVHCSHEELGGMCNLSRASINGVLRRFEAERLIEAGYRMIRVTDADRLRIIVDAS